MFSSQFNDQFPAALSKNWIWLFLWGVGLVILGAAAISASTMATIVTVIVLGSLLIIGGLTISIVAITFWWHKWRGFFPHLFLGLVYLAVGIMLIKSPVLASVSLTLFVGSFYLIVGIFRVIYSLATPIPSWGWSFVNGLISLILGTLILGSWPQSGLFIIGLFIGIDLLFTGITFITASMAARIAK